MKRFLILLYPIAALIYWATGWIIGNNNPVPSSHAFSFLVHSSGWWYLPVLVAAIVFLFINTAGTINAWFTVVTRVWIWILSILLVFASVASMTHTRSSAKDDPNVHYRYNQYRIEKGWDK